MDTDRVIEALEEIYGHGKGMAVYMTIMPGILSDFNQMLDKASLGQEVREQYETEDKRAILSVKGKKSANGQTGISVDVISDPVI